MTQDTVMTREIEVARHGAMMSAPLARPQKRNAIASRSMERWSRRPSAILTSPPLS
jgi:hypothetical protein